MLSTYFYMLVTILEVIWGQTASAYNAEALQINRCIQQAAYQEALVRVERLEKGSFFEDRALKKTKNLLLMRLGRKTEEVEKEENLLLKSLMYQHNGDSQQALAVLKKGIIQRNNNDSLIHMYEILYAHARPKNQQALAKGTQANTKTYTAMRLNDALALLDLMKKKEKYIKHAAGRGL